MRSNFRNDLSGCGVIENAVDEQSDSVAARIRFGGYEPVAQQESAAPVLWLKSDDAGFVEKPAQQSFLLSETAVHRVYLDGQITGSQWSDEDADYCLLAGVTPKDASASRSAQTTSCFEQMERGLIAAGMDISHLVRTWFYLDHLLDWYDEFNVARTEFFERKGIFDRLIPASTGIGTGNAAGTALAAGALAVRKKHAGVKIEEVRSPLQCPATAYRSSFSRAVEIGLTGRRFLTISGTASIAPEGHTVHVGDSEKQIRLTLDVVEAILISRQMGWQDTVRAIGYFRQIEDLELFQAICRERGIPSLPMLPVQATVCRDDLLFEIELDAATNSSMPGAGA